MGLQRKEGWREEEDGDVDKEEDLQRDVVKCNDSTGEVHPGGLRRGIKRTVDGERAGEIGRASCRERVCQYV